MSLISPNFDVKAIIFPNFGQGPIPKIAGKSSVVKMPHYWKSHVTAHISSLAVIRLNSY